MQQIRRGGRETAQGRDTRDRASCSVGEAFCPTHTAQLMGPLRPQLWELSVSAPLNVEQPIISNTAQRPTRSGRDSTQPDQIRFASHNSLVFVFCLSFLPYIHYSFWLAFSWHSRRSSTQAAQVLKENIGLNRTFTKFVTALCRRKRRESPSSHGDKTKFYTANDNNARVQISEQQT